MIFFPYNNHDIWEEVYDDKKNYDWLLSFTNIRKKTPAEQLVGKYFG